MTWANRVAAEDPVTSHNGEGARPGYPAHLVSEVMAFDGVVPDETLGDLSHNYKLQLFRLSGVPSRPCSARFPLADNSVDSKSFLEKIVSMGIQ